MTYTEAINYLESRRPLGIKPGLERVKALLRLFDNPQQGLPCIHVAGSNGKGSTASFLAHMLMARGYRVGQFSSPYFASPCEMFMIQGKPVDPQAFADLVAEAAGYCAQLDHALGQGPTEYEIYACLALVYFKRSGCHYAVIEACMGGRFDCTNVLEEVLACVITRLSLEHQSFLGDTLDKIAWHKAGIMKPGVPVITCPQTAEAMAVLTAEARSLQAPLHITHPEDIKVHEVSREGIHFDNGELTGLKLSSPALYQTENAALALLTMDILKRQGLAVDREALKQGLWETRWPGRFEFLRRRPDFILDCCHNPNGVEAFVKSYRALYGDKKAILIVGVLADKDYGTMMESLSTIASAMIAVTTDSPRALSADILLKVASKYCEFVVKSDTIREAVKKSLNMAGNTGVVCALGSHFHAAAVKEALILKDFGGLLC